MVDNKKSHHKNGGIHLIASNGDYNFEYNGFCKITINHVTSMLFVEPINEEFKPISAIFQWKFYAQKNILFVFADFEFKDFILVFNTEARCQKVYDLIYRKRVKDEATNELIYKRVLLPILNQITKVSNSVVFQILLKWIKKLEKNDKKMCIKMLKESESQQMFNDSATINSELNPEENLAKANFEQAAAEYKNILKLINDEKEKSQAVITEYRQKIQETQEAMKKAIKPLQESLKKKEVQLKKLQEERDFYIKQRLTNGLNLAVDKKVMKSSDPEIIQKKIKWGNELELQDIKKGNARLRNKTVRDEENDFILSKDIKGIYDKWLKQDFPKIENGNKVDKPTSRNFLRKLWNSMKPEILEYYKEYETEKEKKMSFVKKWERCTANKSLAQKIGYII